MSKLRVKNLVKAFNKNTPNEKKVFENLDFDVKEGDFITIIGSNGAGKSTLLNLIAGTLKADEGLIELGDEDLTNLEEYKRTSKIGRVYQDPKLGTSPSLTVMENLSLALNKGKKFNLSFCVQKKNEAFLKEQLAQLDMGLEEHLNSKVGLLSGGQRQALSMIMATITNPKLLLLDEPTAALDPKVSKSLIDLTGKIIEEKQMTALMVTHDLNQAIEMGNRLVMMHRGKVLLDIQGEEKKNLTIEKLLKLFEKAQGNDLISDRLLFS